MTEREELLRLIRGAAYKEPADGTAESAWNAALEHIEEGLSLLPTVAQAAVTPIKAPGNDQLSKLWNAGTGGGVREAVAKVLKTNNWPVYWTQDDNGLEENEYVEFVQEVLAALSPPAPDVVRALENIASFNITPDTGYSVAQAMRRTAQLALAPPDAGDRQ